MRHIPHSHNYNTQYTISYPQLFPWCKYFKTNCLYHFSSLGKILHYSPQSDSVISLIKCYDVSAFLILLYGILEYNNVFQNPSTIVYCRFIT